jgi:PAS domain S-box-containing protein
MAAGSPSFDDDRIELFDLSQDAFCITGFDGYLKRTNPAYARMLGYTREELLARPFIDNFYPDDLEAVKAALAEVVAGNDVVGFECREVCADGSVRWFEWSTSSRPEAGIAYAVGRDVTERRKANDELSALRRCHPGCGGCGALGSVRRGRRGGRPRRGRPIRDRHTLRRRRHGNGLRQLPARIWDIYRRHALVTGRHERTFTGAG